MADIIIIQPEIGKWDYLRTQPSLPLNLLHAATFVDKEYQIKFIDQRVDKNWQLTLKKELAKPILCVGLTSYSGKMIAHALEISEFIKEQSKVPVVWGGVHASLLPEQTLKNRYIDIVVQGEGEVTFLELARALEKGKSLEGLEGVWFKCNGEIYRNPPRPFLNLNELPEVPYHLVDVHRYMPVYRHRPSMPLQTSRGCICKCSYCINSIYRYSEWRPLTAENTIKKLKYLVSKFQVNSIYIIDDNFFVDLERVKKIAQGIINENLNIEWYVQGGPDFNSAEKIGDDLLGLLEKSGCVKISCGIESGSPRIREMINKDGSLEVIGKINRKFSKYNILVYYTFMTGLPGETIIDLKRTIRFLFKLLKENKNARSWPIHAFIPYPATPLTQSLNEAGYKLPSTLEEWMEYDFDNFSFNNFSYISNGLKKILMTNLLYLAPLFVDSKFKEYELPKIIEFFALVYRPIARFRLRHLFLRFMVEKKMMSLFLKLKSKS